MLYKSSIFRLVGSIYLSFTLFACGGGGGGGSNLPAVQIDTISPNVISFQPTGDGIAINSIITISFSEPVKAIKSNNISITEFDSNNKNPRLFTLPERILILDSNKKILEIKLANADPSLSISLSTNKIYRIEVSGIQDTAGNEVLNICSWYFATTGAVVDPVIAATASCNNSGSSSNWGSMIWGQGKWK